MHWIDRADARFGHFAIRHLLHYIAFLAAACFVLYKVRPDLFGYLELYPNRVLAGEVWRLVTYLFVPTICSFLLPLPDWANAAFYVLMMIWMSNGLEDAWGPLKVNLYCLITTVGITIAAFFFGTYFSHFMFVQAVFFAFAMFYPEEQILVLFIPVKVKWLAWADVAWLGFKFLVLGNDFRMALLAVLAGFFVFFGGQIFQGIQHRQRVSGRRQRFEEAQPSDEEAMHRCAVCGRTEHTAPDLDFRVARDGQEYCVEHLPKAAPAEPGA